MALVMVVGTAPETDRKEDFVTVLATTPSNVLAAGHAGI